MDHINLTMQIIKNNHQFIHQNIRQIGHALSIEARLTEISIHRNYLHCLVEHKISDVDIQLGKFSSKYIYLTSIHIMVIIKLNDLSEAKPSFMLLSTLLHQRAASRVQHPKSCGSQQSLPPGGKERLHFVGIRPEVQARKGGW